MKILITGGAGYIGSHTIVEILETTSYDPISVDNFLHSSDQTFARIKDVTEKEVENWNVDLCDLNSTIDIFSKHRDIVGIIHCAALKSVPESVSNPDLYYQNNLDSTRNILECMKNFNIKNVIFSSSCSVYGNIDKLPVNEETPIGKAQSPYGHTKQICETMIEEFVNKNPGFNAISLRYFNPVGAHISGKIGEIPIGVPNNIVPAIARNLMNGTNGFNVFGNDYITRDGTCIRDYIHVSDIASAHILALNYLLNNNEKKNYDVINLGSGSGVTVLEAIKAFETVSGKVLNYKVAPRRPGDMEAIYSDSSKAEKILGWKHNISIEQMMESAWKWQQNQ